MKKIITLAAIITFLVGCKPKEVEIKLTKYTVVVNYIGNGSSSAPPCDTMTIISDTEPYLVVNDNVSYLSKGFYYSPVASYVRSIKILNATKL